jgi:hypothetical protein
MLFTAVPLFVGATWRLPDTYQSPGFRRGTATVKFYIDRDILPATATGETEVKASVWLVVAAASCSIPE